jgi:hypothetical protein
VLSVPTALSVAYMKYYFFSFHRQFSALTIVACISELFTS